MIIELQNFGPIKSFKFDNSKDMHAIFGKNNIGKSYAISAVYLILKGLKSYKTDNFFQFETIFDDNESYQILENKIQDVKSKTNITEEVEKLLKFSVNQQLTDIIQKSFENSFDLNSLQNIHSRDSFKIILSFNEICIEINFLASNKKFITKTVSFNKPNFWEVDTVLGMVTLFKDSVLQGNAIRIQNHGTVYNKIIRAIMFYYVHELQSGIKENIYFLPASRSGLYTTLNSFGAIFAELAKSRTFFTSKIEIPSFSEPTSDYFLNLNNIDDTIISESYSQDFGKIEKDILKGTIGFDKISRRYHYIPDANPDMVFDLSATSSMISEIAPIIAHLKYIIPLESDKPSILFIEEPEAHLHPEIQILLLEYFVKLSKGNVKIVMTSHSNYIFNKLSNLLIANKIDKDKLSVSLMKMTPEGSVIEDGAMQMDEYGIEDDNFVDVAEQLYEERMSLLEKL